MKGTAASLAIAAMPKRSFAQAATGEPILLGQALAYSGPASAYQIIGKTANAYFEAVNDAGGIEGRPVRLMSEDDGYNPAKTVEVTRKLVERDGVVAMFAVGGTPPNAAIQQYLNSKKIPQVFAASGSERFKDPKSAPYTLAFIPSFALEGNIFARHLVATNPNARVGILSFNDDGGRDFVAGFKAGLGDKAGSMITKEVTYEMSDTTVAGQILELKASGADVFVNMTTPKFAVMAIRKAAELQWKPLQFIGGPAVSISSVMIPAGPENSVGTISAGYLKTATDPLWKDDAGMKDYMALMQQRLPAESAVDQFALLGYTLAEVMVTTLRQCGREFSPDRIMKEASNLKETTLSLLLPGLTVKTTPDDYSVFNRLQLQKFDGTSWKMFGDPVQRG
jgi:ABC-type branched-subunit amino acid transport system substrate-binding protein